MTALKFVVQLIRSILRGIGKVLVRQIRLGWRLAYQQPAPASKTKQKGYCLSYWFDVTACLSLIGSGFVLWLQ